MNKDQMLGYSGGSKLHSSKITCFSLLYETLREQVGKQQERSGSPTYRYYKCLTEADIIHATVFCAELAFCQQL
ncbi:hypothetical protein [Nostoc sp.]|uniref:hypothetical protein n=1 Tax=Nostoc sp. TaxID=1180 RepID=UPI002FFC9E87